MKKTLLSLLGIIISLSGCMVYEYKADIPSSKVEKYTIENKKKAELYENMFGPYSTLKITDPNSKTSEKFITTTERYDQRQVIYLQRCDPYHCDWFDFSEQSQYWQGAQNLFERYMKEIIEQKRVKDPNFQKQPEPVFDW